VGPTSPARPRTQGGADLDDVRIYAGQIRLVRTRRVEAGRVAANAVLVPLALMAEGLTDVELLEDEADEPEFPECPRPEAAPAEPASAAGAPAPPPAASEWLAGMRPSNRRMMDLPCAIKKSAARCWPRSAP
jgi:hypothetical protein